VSADRIDLSLTKAEALVFFEWICNLDAGTSAPPDGSPEQKVVCHIAAPLERALPSRCSAFEAILSGIISLRCMTSKMRGV